MSHYFQPSIAKVYGIEEAIILENLFFWVNKNRANNQNFHDGKFWTYNSVRAFNDLFDYMTPSKIARALKKLEEEELINTACLNSNPYDRTKWYTITNKGLALFNIEASIFYNDNSICQNEKSNKAKCEMNVTDINQIINTDNKPDGENNNMIPPPQEPSSDFVETPVESTSTSQQPSPEFSSTSCVNSELLPQIQDCHRKLYDRWIAAGLPLSRSSAQSYFTFSCRELKAALGSWVGKNLAPEELLEALDNYIQLTELVRKGESWMNTVGGFDYFAKHTLDLLDGNFQLDKYRRRSDAKAFDKDEEAKRIEAMMADMGIIENH